MKECFTYMFKDKCFYKKAFVFFVITFLSITLLALSDMSTVSNISQVSFMPRMISYIGIESICLKLIAFCLQILIAGYFISLLEAVVKQKNNIVFPFFNLELCFKKGGSLILSFSCIICVLFLMIFLNFMLSVVVSPTLFKIFLILVNVIIVLYIIFFNSFIYNYAIENRFLAFLNFKQAFLNVKNSPKNYFKYWSILILLNIINTVFICLFEYLLGFCRNPYLIMFFTNIVSSVLFTYQTFVCFMLILKSISVSPTESL